MLNSSLFICLPLFNLTIIIKDLHVVQLFCLDIGEVVVQLHLPFSKDLSLFELLDQVVDSLKSLSRCIDSIAVKIFHFSGIFCEVLRKTCFMTQ
jgi:hypothetical protein